jgi:hypothetical protein
VLTAFPVASLQVGPFQKAFVSEKSSKNLASVKAVGWGVDVGWGVSEGCGGAVGGRVAVAAVGCGEGVILIIGVKTGTGVHPTNRMLPAVVPIIFNASRLVGIS